jgi:hypothetical protein
MFCEYSPECLPNAAAFVDAAAKNEFLSSRFFSTELFMNWPNNFEMQFFLSRKAAEAGDGFTTIYFLHNLKMGTIA